ncbi:MAG: hypothetical protein RLZZ65_1826 [Bacteroidota bacterium]|jgi:hypothetical protein
MKKTLLVFSLLFVNQVVGQKYYLHDHHKFYPQVIEVVKQTEEFVFLSVLHESSLRCACDPEESFKLKKNESGTYMIHQYDDSDKSITVYLKNGVIEKIVVVSDDYGCCAVVDGTYILKKKKKK